MRGIAPFWGQEPYRHLFPKWIGLRLSYALCRHPAEGKSQDFGIEVGVQIGHLPPPHAHHVDAIVNIGCTTRKRGGVSPLDDDRRIPW